MGQGNMSDHGASSLTLSEEAFILKGGQNMMVHLKITPKMEGFLHIVGVKWILSGTVMGRHDFAPQSVKKQRNRGRNRDDTEYPPHQRLKFVVLKHLPRLEGTIHQMPVKCNVGELRRLVLELSNRSGTRIKNMKLKTNHPRFLMAGELEDLDAEFPVCLEAQANDKSHLRWNNEVNSGVKEDSSDFIFLFPKNVSLEGGSMVLWPLWLHTVEAGTISLSISIYYETETPSADMNYRTMRMQYDVQVLPSLDVSVHITPCPSKLQEFLLRLDIVNKNNLESFWLRQVSSVGMRWKLSSLVPSLLENINASGDICGSNGTNIGSAYLSASVCPSQLLPAGQALSLFFKLMDSNEFTALKDSANSVNSKQFSSDVRLGPPSSSEPLISVAGGPLSKFHLQERIAQKKSSIQNPMHCSGNSDSPSALTQEYGNVDLILIAEQQDEPGNLRVQDVSDAQRIFSHHICHCSVKSLSPIWWIMEGPKTVIHDFTSLPFCEIKFHLTIRNCSDVTLSIQIETSDNGPVMDQISDVVQSPSASGNQVGWHDISLETDDTRKVIFEPGQGPSSIKSVNEFPDFHTLVPCSPRMWCALSATKIAAVREWSSVTVPLSLTVFAPGIYDLSNYRILWELHPDVNDKHSKHEIQSLTSTAISDSAYVPATDLQKETSSSSAYVTEGPSSRVGLGHPFLLTVLQSI